MADPLNRDRPQVTLCPLAPAHLVGLGLFQIALVLALAAPRWSWVPLAAFVLMVGLAPFFPAWRLFLPVTSRARHSRAVALTFDDGPDPATTERLLDLLERFEAKAAFFVVGSKAAAHPELLQRILARGHEVGNHTQDHDLMLMLRSTNRLRRSIGACQASLAALGVRPRAFRPPAWIVGPRLWRVLLEQGLTCVVASVRGLDLGNRRLGRLARRVLARVRGGDIVALHDRQPPGAATVEHWLEQVERLLAGLRQRGLEPVRLSTLIGRPVAEPTGGDPPGAWGSVQSFYQALAESYDAEQKTGGQRSVRASEERVVRARLPALLSGHERVLEVGAGTGRFTLELARRAKLVVALDLSTAMLAKLRAKASAADATNIEIVAAQIQDAELEAGFDLICSFSTFEYLADLNALVEKLAGLLAPSGLLYCTTARRSWMRWFAQLGNAMRQGIWLHARSRAQFQRALHRAGLRVEVQRPFGPGGVLVEVLAGRPKNDASG